MRSRYPHLIVLNSFILIAAVFLFSEKQLRAIGGYSLILLFYFLFFLPGFKFIAGNIDMLVSWKRKYYAMVPIGLFLFSMIPCFLVIPNTPVELFLFIGIYVESTVFYFGLFLIYVQYGKRLLNDMNRQLKNRKGDKSAKKTKKLLLINPQNPDKMGLSKNIAFLHPPMALGVIAAMTPDEFEIKIIDENVDDFDFEDADLVGITSLTTSISRAYLIAEEYRKRNVPVVMGGVHVSAKQDEALQYVDTIVIGEAESVWAQVIEDFKANNLKQKYYGEHLDPSRLVEPRRDLFSNKYLFATVQTSRGCPLNCIYCAVTAFNGNKFRQRDPEDILDELERIPQQNIFFVDDNIIGYGKKAEKRAIQLFKGMVERKLNKKWVTQTSINFADNPELLYWAKKSGCQVVFIGFESPTPEDLKEMNKPINIKRDYQTVLNKINDHGIGVCGAFIYGTDHDTPEYLKKKSDFIWKIKFNVNVLMVMTPFPGTQLYQKMLDDNRLLFINYPEDWKKYDTFELVTKIIGNTEDKFWEEYFKITQRLYSPVNFVKMFIYNLFRTRNFEGTLWCFMMNQGYAKLALQRREWHGIDRRN